MSPFRVALAAALVLVGCEAAPPVEAPKACWRLARMPTVEVLQSGGGYNHAVVLSAVVPDQPPGGVAGATVPDGWQIQYATRQVASAAQDPIVRSRQYAAKAEGAVGLTFLPPPEDRYPTNVDLDLTFDFVDTAGTVSQWAVAASLPVERCE